MDCLDIFLALPAEIRWMIYKMLSCKVQQVMELGYELKCRACAASLYYGRRPGGPELEYLTGAAAMGHIKCLQYELERNNWFLFYLRHNIKVLHRAIEHCQVDMVKFLFEIYDRYDKNPINRWTYTELFHHTTQFVRITLGRFPDSAQKQKLISILKSRGLYLEPLCAPQIKKVSY